VFTLSRQHLAQIIAAAHVRELEIVEGGRGLARSTWARAQLLAILDALDGDDLIELVALAWIGRGDFEWSEWPRAVAQSRNLISTRPAEYLADLPGFPYYLQSALASLGDTFAEN